MYDGLVWLLLLLGPLLILQRKTHKDIQAIILLLTRRADVTIVIFSIIFLPGVFLHEFSHWIIARILQVRTGRFSIIPKPLKGGKLQLGSVETAKADIFRDSIIGVAPLLLGVILTGYIGLVQLGALELFDAMQLRSFEQFGVTLAELPKKPDFWLWFYLAYAISSTMFPSASDRRTWTPVLIFVVIIVGIALLAGAGEWMAQNLAPWVNGVMRSVAMVFGVSVGIHIILLIPLWGLHLLLSRITGLKVQ